MLNFRKYRTRRYCIKLMIQAVRSNPHHLAPGEPYVMYLPYVVNLMYLPYVMVNHLINVIGTLRIFYVRKLRDGFVLRM